MVSEFDGDGRPNAEWVNQLALDTFSTHRERISEMTAMLDLVGKRMQPFSKPPDPQQYTPLIPGTAGKLVHRGAHQVATDRPVVTYEPRNDSFKARNEADLAEVWGASILESVAANAIAPPLTQATKWAMVGMWVLKGPMFNYRAWPAPPSTDDPDALKRYRVAQAENPPFIWQTVDPRQFVWDESNPQNPRWGIQRQRQRVFRLKGDFPLLDTSGVRSLSDKNGMDFVDRTDYCTPHWRLTLADGAPVSYYVEETGEMRRGAIENIYGYQLYQVGFGPFAWADGKPEEMGRGLLYFVRDELIEQARMASLKRWMAQLHGMPPIIAADPEAFVRYMSAGPGAVVPPGSPADLNKTAPRPMEMPSPPEWINTYRAEIDASIDDMFPPALGGERQAGMTSGLMSGLHIGEARTMLMPVVRQLELQTTRFLNRCAAIHENIVREPMSVWATKGRGRALLTMKPDDWRGNYHFDVDLEPTDPTRDDRRGMLGLNYFNVGLLDPWTTLEDYLREPNAAQIIRRVMKWKTMNSPEFQMLMTQAVAEENEVEDEINAMLGLADSSGVNQGDFEPFDGSGVPGPEGSEQASLDFPTRNQGPTPRDEPLSGFGLAEGGNVERIRGAGADFR